MPRSEVEKAFQVICPRYHHKDKHEHNCRSLIRLNPVQVTNARQSLSRARTQALMLLLSLRSPHLSSMSQEAPSLPRSHWLSKLGRQPCTRSSASKGDQCKCVWRRSGIVDANARTEASDVIIRSHASPKQNCICSRSANCCDAQVRPIQLRRSRRSQHQSASCMWLSKAISKPWSSNSATTRSNTSASSPHAGRKS